MAFEDGTGETRGDQGPPRHPPWVPGFPGTRMIPQRAHTGPEERGVHGQALGEGNGSRSASGQESSRRLAVLG